MEDAFCFCGSGKAYNICHAHVSKASMVAQLYALQNVIDTEIEKQRVEHELSFKCKPGCCECCSKCFFVSETEFVQILDWMIHNWDAEKIYKIIRKAQAQWKTLESEAPETARIINRQTTAKELLESREIIFPFPCIFLDEDGYCSIYSIRPLACRTHGTGIVNLIENIRPCSKLPPILSAWDRYANLTAFGKDMSDLIFLNYDKYSIVRNPLPLLSYFEIVFKDVRTLEDIINSDFYQGLVQLDKKDYVDALII